jgi:DNA-directed RNA polymerase specialized sigma24 family protein
MVMEYEQLVRQAGGGDVKAFVELTRRFQQFAFGTALALVHDFQNAEDVVQEAFIAAFAFPANAARLKLPLTFGRAATSPDRNGQSAPSDNGLHRAIRSWSL